jgi:hypothetical protein
VRSVEQEDRRHVEESLTVSDYSEDSEMLILTATKSVGEGARDGYSVDVESMVEGECWMVKHNGASWGRSNNLLAAKGG